MKRKQDPRLSTAMRMYIRSLLVQMLIPAFVFVSIFGCATSNRGRGSGVGSGTPPVTAVKTDDPSGAKVEETDLRENRDGPSARREQSFMVGKTHMIRAADKLRPMLAVMPGKNADKNKNQERNSDSKVHVELAFDNADLYEVLDVTLFELYNVNYMVDPSIKAKVTFHLSGDFTRSQFINILNNVLQLNDLSIVKGPGETFKVVRRASSAGLGNTLLALEPETDQAGDITRMIRLRYVAVSTAAKNIQPFLSKDAVMVQDPVTNSLIITDTTDNLDKAAGILSMMDVEYFADISWRIFSITETDAAEMAVDLSRILKNGGLFNRPGVDPGSFEIVPVTTMNALLVATRWPAILELIDDWITAMDHADDSGTNVFVYFVENGTAVELADILKQLYGGTPSGSAKRTIVKPSAQPGLAGELSGNVEIIPDETNNAIVFKATGRDYKIIQEVLRKLDIVPRQVLINVIIAEITLNGSLEYGVQWFLKDRAQSGYKIHGVLDNGMDRAVDTALGAGTKGLSAALFDSEDVLRGLITALETEGEVNILSSPNILALDNKESVIEVGEQVPIPIGETITDGGTTIKTIQYRDTGVLLTVTPHINSSGLVKIEVVQEVSEVGTKDQDLDAFSFLNRKAKTSLVIEDGQTIFIGGLMRTKQTSSGSGIPVLRRIPLLGYAFGGKSKNMDKVELIFLITPRVITNRAEADAITKEFSKRVGEVKELINQKDF